MRATVARTLIPNLSPACAVIAVGGYGRRELFPYSDIDLLFLFDAEPDPAKIKGAVAETLRVLWDAGLRVSHSVRTVNECVRLHEQNIELHVSLLDLRYVCGNQEVYDHLARRLPEFWTRYSLLLVKHLVEMTRGRHAKFNDTVYHLEPHVKDAPGAIRDVHLLYWLAELAPQQEAFLNLRDHLGPALDFLYGLRCFLHFRAGRDSNLLTFELQDEAAMTLSSLPQEPAQWMRRYYWHARQISQTLQRALEHAEAQDSSLLRQFRDWRSRLSNADYTISRERVYLRNPNLTVGSTETLFGLFTYVARHGLHLSWDAQRRLSNDQKSIAEILQATPPQWPLWRELLQQPYAALALRSMQEAGILSLALPEWASIDSLVVRDFYHRYTVDEHTFVAISVIDGLQQDSNSYPLRFRSLLSEDGQVGLLRLALLLHDIGKGTTPGEHVSGSIDAADQVSNRIGLRDRDHELLLFLIRHHLDLSMVMNSRDLGDPATARYLATRITTLERLRRLTLLTFADISAVNPTAMTSWRMEQLWRAYSTGQAQLTRDLEMDRIHGVDDSLDGSVADRSELGGFLEGFPTRYLRTHSPDEIRRHFKLANARQQGSVAIKIDKHEDAYLATVIAQEQPGFFAALSGALAGFGMNILKGEAFSNKAGLLLDEIRFDDPLRNLDLNPTEIDRLSDLIRSVVSGRSSVEDLLKGRRPVGHASRVARIKPSIHFNNDASDAATLIDFVGEDRPGLLYQLASCLAEHGCDIDLVMIDTEAHKAVDVFYVTCNGQKLDDVMQDRLAGKLLKVAAN